METQNENWPQGWKRVLPSLALVGPICFLIASLVRAMGIGTLSGDLSWVSTPEGMIMTIGLE